VLQLFISVFSSSYAEASVH